MSISLSTSNINLAAATGLPQPLSASVTRILSLSGFPPELKTRDIHAVFGPWENERGGFKIKWIDDTSALVVFADATVAKRAYLQTLLAPPAILSSPTSTKSTIIRPYDGPDAQAIIANVNARTTSTSAGSGRTTGSRASFSLPNGLANGHIRAASMAAAIPMSASSRDIKWAPKAGSPVSPVQQTLPGLPYAPSLNTLMSSSGANGSALATSPSDATEPPSAISAASPVGPPRVGDPGRRLVAGALGVRHPSLRRASPPAANGSPSGVDELTKVMAATQIEV